MNRLAISLLLLGFISYSAGCQTPIPVNRNNDSGFSEKEPTIYLCFNTQPPDDHTDMKDFSQAERITDFTRLSSNEMWFGATIFSEGIYRSKDDGKTWENVKIPDAQNVSAFDFIDSQNGVLINRELKFYLWRTQDGGNSWVKTNPFKSFIGKIVPPDVIKFSSIKKGIMYSGDDDILETSDGGENWKPIKIPSYADRIAYYSLNDDDAWIAFGKNSTVMYVMRKEGVNWKLYKVPNASNYSAPESIFFLDRNSGWISSDMGEVFTTKNGGKNWEKLNLGTIKIFIKTMFWNDSQNGWLAGSGNENQALLIKTNDGGKTWNIVQTKAEVFFSKIFFTNQNDGWLISREKIYKTSDGGKIWKPILTVSLSCK